VAVAASAGFAESVRFHVVEEDDVDEAGGECEDGVELFEAVGFDLDEAEGSVGAGAVGRVLDEGGEFVVGEAGEVVVFEEDRVGEVESVRASAAAADGVFLEGAESGCGFACVVEAGGVGGGGCVVRSGGRRLVHGVEKACGERGDACEACEEVEEGSLDLENGLEFAREGGECVAGGDGLAVGEVCGEGDGSFGVEGSDEVGDDGEAGDVGGLPGDDAGGGGASGERGGGGGDVAVA